MILLPARYLVVSRVVLVYKIEKQRGYRYGRKPAKHEPHGVSLTGPSHLIKPLHIGVQESHQLVSLARLDRRAHSGKVERNFARGHRPSQDILLCQPTLMPDRLGKFSDAGRRFAKLRKRAQ